jgi:methionine-rich copper-binding protein CopC
MRRIFFTAVACASASFIASAVQAHGYLLESYPSRNQHVVQPIKTVKLQFSITADARYSTVSITGEDGSILARKTQPEASHNIEIPAPQLHPGRYQVVYRILSPDGDMVSGKIDFVVDG